MDEQNNNNIEYDDNGVRKNWWSGLKDGFSKVWNHRAIMKRTEFATLSAAFSHKNKHALIILADPETDVIFVSYDDQHAVNRITDVTGKSMRVIKKALDGREESIMNLLGYIGSAMKENNVMIKARDAKRPRLIFSKKFRKFDNHDQMRKANEGLKIEKGQAKKKREIEMNRMRQDQQKIDIETGIKKVGTIDKLKDLFRRRIIK